MKRPETSEMSKAQGRIPANIEGTKKILAAAKEEWLSLGGTEESWQETLVDIGLDKPNLEGLEFWMLIELDKRFEILKGDKS